MPYDAITAAALKYLTGRDPGASGLRAAIELKHPGAVRRARARVDAEREARRFTGNPPRWAINYVRKYQPRLDSLRWHRSRVGTFHGTCYGGSEISVTVPYEVDEASARMLVLHELAHAAVPYDHHGDGFYREWARLLTAEGLYRKALAKYGSGRAGALRRGARANRAV